MKRNFKKSYILQEGWLSKDSRNLWEGSLFV